MAPTWNNSAFFFPAQGRHAPPSLTSARLNVITTALSTTLPALSRVTYTPCLCFPLFASVFSSEWPFPSPTNFGSLTLFLIYATAHRNYRHSPHPAPPLAFHRVAHPWLFLRRQLLHTFFVSLNVLLLPFSVSVVLCLLVYHFFACQFSRNYPRQFFRGGAFLYSGFNFSHYDLPFPTRYCIPYVRSGFYQLVIRVKGFRVSAHDLDSHYSVLSIGVDTTLSESVECVSLVHGPRWLFLLSRHREAISAAANQKPFVNKDLCTKKSVKRTIKVVRAKRLASAWQLKMSGSFSRELEQYSYND